MHVEEAPPEIQDIFDQQLAGIAKRLGYDSPDHYHKVGLQGLLYHYTINFMAGHSVEHGDEWMRDGPGFFIFNLALQIAGLFYLLDMLMRASGVKMPMSAVWQEPGDCVGFSGNARIFMLHGVLRAMDIKRLPRTKEEMKNDPLWRGRLRVVGTLRGGPIPLPAQKDWYDHLAEDYGIPNPFTVPERAQKTTIKKEAAGKRASTRLAAPTLKKPTTSAAIKSPPTTSTTKASPRRSTGAKANLVDGGVLVSSQYAHLPRIGTTININANVTYGACKVLGLFQNLVVTDRVALHKAVVVQSGMLLRMHIPPLDDTVTEISVLAVGEIWGPSANSTKYRAAVIRRKRGV